MLSLSISITEVNLVFNYLLEFDTIITLYNDKTSIT